MKDSLNTDFSPEISPDINNKIQIIKKEVNVLKKELHDSALNDPEMQMEIKVYKAMGLNNTEIEKRVVSNYATRKNILEPIDDIPLAENTFTIGTIGTSKFTPIDYCLGIVMQDADGLEYAAHILAEEDEKGLPYLSKEATNISDQIKRIFNSNPTKIKLISPHVGQTEQHKVLIKEFSKRYPSVTPQFINAPGI